MEPSIRTGWAAHPSDRPAAKPAPAATTSQPKPGGPQGNSANQPQETRSGRPDATAQTGQPNSTPTTTPTTPPPAPSSATSDPEQTHRTRRAPSTTADKETDHNNIH